MFEVGFWEISLIGVIALLVIGPERLPAAARTVGLYVGRIRRYVNHVRSDIEREINAEELRQIVNDPTGENLGSLRDVVEETKAALTTVRDDLQEAERSVAEATHTAASNTPVDWTANLGQHASTDPAPESSPVASDSDDSGRVDALATPATHVGAAADETPGESPATQEQTTPDSESTAGRKTGPGEVSQSPAARS